MWCESCGRWLGRSTTNRAVDNASNATAARCSTFLTAIGSSSEVDRRLRNRYDRRCRRWILDCFPWVRRRCWCWRRLRVCRSWIRVQDIRRFGSRTTLGRLLYFYSLWALVWDIVLNCWRVIIRRRRLLALHVSRIILLAWIIVLTGIVILSWITICRRKRRSIVSRRFRWLRVLKLRCNHSWLWYFSRICLRYWWDRRRRPRHHHASFRTQGSWRVIKTTGQDERPIRWSVSASRPRWVDS